MCATLFQAKVAEKQKPKSKWVSVLELYLEENVATLVAFAVIYNFFTWLLQITLGWGPEFFQHHWEQLVDRYPNPIHFYSTAGVIVTFGSYWIWGSFLSLLDWNGWLAKYKVQPDTNSPPDRDKYIRAVLTVTFNQLVIGAPFAYIGYYFSDRYLGTMKGIEEIRVLPSFYRVLLELPLHYLFQEVFFYYSHRMLHHKSIYKYIHKQHHEWTAPIGIVSSYAHPIEYIFSDMLPVMLGTMTMCVHPISMYLWFVYSMCHTVNIHSGYHLPFLQSPEQHDYHHLKFNQNYGIMGLMDHIHDTDAQWRLTKSKQRHMPLYSFEPIRELIPDVKGD